MGDVKIKEVMTHLVVTLRRNDSLHEAAVRLAQNQVSGAPVTENGKVVGVISESDILKALTPRTSRRMPSVLDWLTNAGNRSPRANKEGLAVEDAMSDIVIETGPESSIWDAADTMTRRRVNRLPVVDEDGYLVGIVSRADLVRVMGRDNDSIRADALAAMNMIGEETIEDVTVAVSQGFVTLAGKTDRKSTKEILTRLIRKVPGVTGVADELSFEVDDSHPHILTREEEKFIFGPTRR
jgi:CBS domain-containing protein